MSSICEAVKHPTWALKPYPAYKDSGVAWLGEVPALWEVERLKCSLANIVEQAAKPSTSGIVVALENVESWTGRVALTDSESSFESQLKIFLSGDVLFGKLRPYLAKVTRLTSGGLCVGEFLVLRPRHEGVMGSYFEYFLRSKPIIDAVTASTFGAKMPRADWQFIGSLPVVRPPITEQAAIVHFLDRADRRIRRYTRARERLTALLEEQKQAVVHEAVTGRIDVRTGQPYPAYKPSGVEWLGEVPAHWDVRRVKQLFRRIVGGSTPSSNERRFWDGPHVWVTPADVGKSTHIHGSQRRLTQEGLDNCSAELLPIGSIVVTTRAPVGNVALARVPFCTNQGCKALTPREREIDSSFAFFLLGGLQTELRSLANGTTFTEISGNKLGGVRLPVPPLPEQAAIAAYIDKATAEIDTAVARANREIELLREYRTRLIADVVTGKLDVREAAAALPELDPLAADDEAGNVPDAGDAPSLDRETRPAMAAG